MIIKEEAQKIAEKEAVRDGCDFIRYLKTHGELFVFLAGFKTSQKTGLSLLSRRTGMERQGLFRHKVFHAS